MPDKFASIRIVLARIVVMLACALGVAIAAPRASAQMFGGAGQFDIPVTKPDIDRFGELMNLNDEQKAQVNDIYQSFSQQHAESAKKAGERIQEVMQDYQENRDPSVFSDMVKEMLGFQADMEKQQKTMYDDMKLLLDEKQLADWPKFERRVRRQQIFRQNTQQNLISGSAVDLVTVVEDQKLGEEQMAAVEPVLDQYEVDMDRLVTAMKKLQEEQTKEFMENPEETMSWMTNKESMDKMEERFAEGRTQLVQVRDLNTRTSRQIAALLSDEERPKFERSFNESALPQVYRENYVGKSFKTVAGMEDLTSEQRTQVNELKAQYERELTAANQKWATALQEWEVGMKILDMMPAGSRPAELKESQQARKDLDTRTYEKLGQLLTEEQREKLPSKLQSRSSSPDAGG